MFGVIILIAVTFVAVVAMGVSLFSKSDEIRKLKVELETPKKDSGSELLDINAMYRVIQEEGYFPTKDADGDITFKIKGTKIVVGECAKGFVYTRAYYYDLDKESVQAGLHAANVVNMVYVAVKTIIVEENDSLVFSVESFCNDIETYRAFFQRSVSILSDSIEVFQKEIQKYSDRQASPQLIS